MATRLYLSNLDSPQSSYSTVAGWGSYGFSRKRATPASLSDAMSDAQLGNNSSIGTTVKRVMYMFVSPPLSVGQVIGSGSINVQVRSKQDRAGSDAVLAFSAEIKGSQGQNRATLLPTTVGSNEFSYTSLVNRGHVDNIVSNSYVTVSGDRLAIYIGASITQQDSGVVIITQRFGTSSSSDLPENETSTSDFKPWVEFDSTITFDYPTTVPIGVGSYTLNGQDVTLKGPTRLSVEIGDYVISGQSSSLKFDRLAPIVAGAYTLNGQIANLSRGFSIIPDVGNYTLTGQNTDLTRNRFLGISTGLYNLSGQAATLSKTGDSDPNAIPNISSNNFWLLIDK